MTTRDPLGRGLAFPPRLDADGRWAWSSGDENVRDNIRVILSTELGERVMRPRFGAGLGTFVHEPNVVATHRLIEERIRTALMRWERRIRVEVIEVAGDPQNPRAAVATVRYALIATGTPEHLSVSVDLGGP
ncbi:GPW/gp25 family protein [Myxococcota bacterium]|nr:GPW/gp25 family protein [Myxococcota bacterium]